LLSLHEQVPSRSRPLTAKYSLFKRADIVRKALWRRIWCLSPLNSKFVSSFNGEGGRLPNDCWHFDLFFCVVHAS
jgi:hypothetical protein